MTQSKKVSIGMPVYNGERFLTQTLSNLLEQDYQNLEIIISDNCSTDSTERISEEFTNKDSRILYHRNDRNLGAPANFNNLIKMTTGDYFMWTAHDDLRHPSFISTMVKLLESQSISIAFSIPNAIDEKGVVFADAPRFMELAGNNPVECMEHFITQDEIWGKANLIYGLMRREQVLASGGIKAWGWNDWGTDYLFVFNMLRYGIFAIHSTPLFFKRLILPSQPGMLNQSRRKIRVTDKLRGLKPTLQEYFTFCGYLYGYWNIIQDIQHLDWQERFFLGYTCVRRASRQIYTKLKTLLS